MSWKDQRAYNALLNGVCHPCYLYGQKKKTRLPNRTKALNHWSSDGSGHRDRAATIKDCLYAHKVVGLVAYAQVENKQRALSKQMKQDEAARQCEVDMVIDFNDPTELGPPPRRSVVSKQTATGSQSSTPDRIKFVAGWVSKLDRSIANLVVEEATPLALASKPAFREMINTAIEIGTHIGKGVYAHSGEKRLRNDTIPAVIKKQESTTSLVDFDSNLARFGGTLVSDGKDDVSHDHLINYLTVCPDG